MSSAFQNAKLTRFAEYLTPASTQDFSRFREVYEENRHRVYALAFWMTDNEIVAEEVMGRVFERAFALTTGDTPEAIDCALITELRAIVPFDTLTLKCAPSTKVAGVRRNTKRVDLERAVIQLPPTERLVFLMHDVEGYDHPRIARLLGLTQTESQGALHQARLRIRELLVMLHF
jgi:RNA polymerase sigma-70 factor, ECF subfamily